MPQNDLRVTDQAWRQLRDHCKSSFRKGLCPETGAIGLLGENSHDGGRELLLARLLTPGPGDLKVATSGEVVFDSSYIRRAHLEMRRKDLAGLAVFHTHPTADASVRFSPYDDDQEPNLVRNLLELEPRTKLVSVVLGKRSQCGRVWESPDCSADLGRLVIVGEALQELPLNGNPSPPAPAPAALFDRAMAVTNAGALSALSKMRIAVVGAGGTGSIVCLLLACAGCKELLVVDRDIMKEHNRPRSVFPAARGARIGTPKVDVIRQGIEALEIGCRVDTLQESILADGAIRELRSSDVVFGCVDKACPRKSLCSFSYRYLRPYIDVGAEIGGDDRGIVSLDTRASYVAPGRPCLQCTGVVTARQLAFESLASHERRRVMEHGYSDDLVMNQPAVMDLNMGAARLGVMILRHLLQPFLSQPLPLAITENLITYSTRAIRSARDGNPKCPTCIANEYVGFGDAGSQSVDPCGQ